MHSIRQTSDSKGKLLRPNVPKKTSQVSGHHLHHRCHRLVAFEIRRTLFIPFIRRHDVDHEPIFGRKRSLRFGAAAVGRRRPGVADTGRRRDGPGAATGATAVGRGGARRAGRASTAVARAWNELLGCPRVDVVGEGGCGAGGVQLGDAGACARRGDGRVLVTDVTHHVAAEVGPVRTRRTAEPLQLL